MKVLGIIAEYNPFHNGHAYQMHKAQETVKPDATIIVMSGNFTQRGEPAIVDKWARTEMALRNGANLVFELPFACAASSAERFSEAAVGILAGTRLLTHLSFGTETESIDTLLQYAQILEDEPGYYKECLREQLDSGVSYARASDIALNSCLYGRSEPGLLNTPNSILAVQYLRHLLRYAPSVYPVPILRYGPGYHDPLEYGDTGNIASASGIRKYLHSSGSNNIDDVGRFMPDSSSTLLTDEILRVGGAMSWNRFESTLLTVISQRSREIYPIGIGEGLENRLSRAIESASGVDDLLSRLKTKRYHRTRLQRILLHYLIGISGRESDEIFTGKNWLYLRVLGFDRTGQTILAHIKRRSEIPIITKPDSNTDKMDIWPCIKWDIRATDIYSYHYPRSEVRVPRRDYRTGPIRI